MRTIEWNLKDEQGSAIVMTMMVLALLTIIGIAAINLSTTEVMTAGSELKFRRNFFTSEAAVVEGCDQLEAVQIQALKSRTRQGLGGLRPDWIRIGEGSDKTGATCDALDMEDVNNWDWDGADNDDTALASTDFAGSYFALIEDGIYGSLDMTQQNEKRQYKIYGRFNTDVGPMIIEVGYVKNMY